MLDLIHQDDKEGEFLNQELSNEENESDDVPLSPGDADVPFTVPQ